MPGNADQWGQLDPSVRKITIAGCPVDSITRADTPAFVERVIAERRPSRLGFVNAGKVVRVQSDPELLEALASCDLINADGMAVVWASRIPGRPLPERVNGTNMMMDLIELAHRKGDGLYFLGARPEVVVKVARIPHRDYSGINLVGRHHGHFGPEEEQSIVREIRHLNPDIVFVSFGTPKKELRPHRNVTRTGVPSPWELGEALMFLTGFSSARRPGRRTRDWNGPGVWIRSFEHVAKVSGGTPPFHVVCVLGGSPDRGMEHLEGSSVTGRADRKWDVLLGIDRGAGGVPVPTANE